MWKFTNKYVPNNTHGKISKFSRNTAFAEWRIFEGKIFQLIKILFNLIKILFKLQTTDT